MLRIPKLRLFRKRQPPPGSRPGTLVVHEGAPPPVVTLVRYREDACETHAISDLDQLDELVSDDWVVWIDVTGLGDHEILDRLRERFRLHPLLVEDLVNVPQRPKIDVYDRATLVVSRMLRYHDETGFENEQVSFVLADNVVLSFQEREGDVFDPVRARMKDGKGRMRRRGSSYLVYALMDALVDAYYPVLEQIGEAIEDIVDELLERPDNEVLRHITGLRSELLAVRRAVLPQRDALARLAGGEIPGFAEDMPLFIRDVLDHTVQIADVMESYRELVGGLLNTYLTVVSNRTNEVMRVLTIMASIFIPLTFIAGIYGMNFEHMPELKYRWSYPTLLGIMGVVAGGMLWWFKRNKWL